MIKYWTFGLSISFISWLVGMIINGILIKTELYKKLANLNFISSKTLNKNMGMSYFKWVVKNTPFKFFNDKISLKEKKVELTEIPKEMTKAEISHLIGFLFVCFFALYKGYKEGYLFGLIIMVVNTLMNLYPSL